MARTMTTATDAEPRVRTRMTESEELFRRFCKSRGWHLERIDEQSVTQGSRVPDFRLPDWYAVLTDMRGLDVIEYRVPTDQGSPIVPPLPGAAGLVSGLPPVDGRGGARLRGQPHHKLRHASGG